MYMFRLMTPKSHFFRKIMYFNAKSMILLGILITLEKLNVEFGKIKCWNSFWISFTINLLQIFKNKLGTFCNAKFIKWKIEIEMRFWIKTKFCIWWKINLNSLETTFEISFPLHFSEASIKRAFMESLCTFDFQYIICGNLSFLTVLKRMHYEERSCFHKLFHLLFC